MTTPQDTKQYIPRAAVDAEGTRIGKITKVYRDEQTGQPLWVLVETGLLGTRQSFAPIHGSRLDGEQLAMLAVSEDQVKNAPDINADAHISQKRAGRPPPVLPRLSWHRRVDQRSPGKLAGRTQGRRPGSRGIALGIALRRYLLLTTARLGGLAGRSWRNASLADPQWK
jgi:hypothetical protein